MLTIGYTLVMVTQSHYFMREEVHVRIIVIVYWTFLIIGWFYCCATSSY